MKQESDPTGMGGAMDLVSSPDQTKIIVLTDHCDRKGRPKIVQECSLPLTGARCVSMIITDLVRLYHIRREITELKQRPQAVFTVDRKAGKLMLTELMPGVTLSKVRQKTGATFDVAEGLGEVQV